MDKEFDLIKCVDCTYCFLEPWSDLDVAKLSVWRPLTGPNDDWPLALCDHRSVNDEEDIINGDILHTSRVGENQLLYYNERHQWYYVPGQQPEDLLVFRNTDSTGQRAS